MPEGVSRPSGSADAEAGRRGLGARLQQFVHGLGRERRWHQAEKESANDKYKRQFFHCNFVYSDGKQVALGILPTSLRTARRARRRYGATYLLGR